MTGPLIKEAHGRVGEGRPDQAPTLGEQRVSVHGLRQKVEIVHIAQCT